MNESFKLNDVFSNVFNFNMYFTEYKGLDLHTWRDEYVDNKTDEPATESTTINILHNILILDYITNMNNVN